jgi:spore maturation protein CgeB
MRVVLFCHSLLSDWNHGNAHFLRGVVGELQARGHEVRVFEPDDAWSHRMLLAEAGPAAIAGFHRVYPRLGSTRYSRRTLDLDRALDGADLVIVHEWNEPSLVRRIGRHRASRGGYVLLFHDTHHRSVSDERGWARYDLTDYDGVLVFGEVLRQRYMARGWARNVWTWHEGADTRIFRPMDDADRRGDLVWIGNWGDDERSAELRTFLIDPAADLRLRAAIHGVRYPADALAELRRAGIAYRGWLPNYSAPSVFSRFAMTVHVPRRPYVTTLPGIPTIRVFEALACGIPLISSWWDDREGLFEVGRDFLMVRTGDEMRQAMRDVLHDPEFAAGLAAHGLSTIHARHTCGHRVDELLAIVTSLRPTPQERMQIA